MKLKYLITAIFIYFVAYQVFAQTETLEQSKYYQAQEMFNTGNYVASMKLFNEIYSDNSAKTFSEKSNTLYCLGICNKKIGNNEHAEKYLLEFIDKYPESCNVQSARWELARLRFDKKNYKGALEMYEKIGILKLSDDQKEEYLFNTGYCYLKTNKTGKAAKQFFEIKDSATQYGKAASYYYAHISYNDGNYESALNSFRNLFDDSKFGTSSKHYALRILSIQKRYEEVIALSKNTPATKNKKDNAETNLIVADAYYNTHQYDTALSLMLANATSPTREQNYQMGVCYFVSDNYSKALPYFEKAAAKNDELGQNAYYHVGLCNLKNDNKQFAANAFRNAYKLDSNKQIQETSLLNYVKIVYETGFDPYNEAISALQNYINTSDNPNGIEEAHSYLAKLFLATKNYKNALTYIDKVEIKTPELKLAQQKITFSSALAAFNKQNYAEAIPLFKESQKFGLDKAMAAGATYWEAESYYRMQQYDNAIIEFEKFLDLPAAYDLAIYPQAEYSIGYCYFKQKIYASAETYFRRYIKSEDQKNTKLLCDAWNRTGDCNFIQQNFKKAIQAYNNTIKLNNGNVDYAYYYKALATGATGDLHGKVNTLSKIVSMPESTYFRSNAIYEMANTYTVLDKSDNAIASYQLLISEYPRSPFAIKAKQKLGLLYYSTDNYEKAIATLKDVVVSYPGTIEAGESLASLKNIYIEDGKTDEYLDFVKNTAKIITSVSEADSMSFSSAQNTFVAGKYTEAKNLLITYLDRFPQGAFVPTSYYYLGECYFVEKDYDNALTNYQTATEYDNTLYAENAKIQLGKIFFYNEDYRSAANIYEDLAKNTEYDYVAHNSEEQLMRCYKALNEYDKTLSISTAIYNRTTTPQEIKDEAELSMAESLYGLGRFNEAYNAYKKISDKRNDGTGAEAKYFCSFIKYINEDYTAAETEAFELIDKYQTQDFWVARTFILLADVYMKTGNTFQAKQTLQSIIDNYSGEDLKSEAQSKLDAIQ
ncbi:MAG: tetratricopeptide repeat protein [Bacteroidales bacterium]|nr:tetratricopeptide repeat protein [Bacteroidales bacterium]